MPVLTIEASPRQQWLMLETQLTRIRIEAPNRSPPDLLRGVITGPGQRPIVVFRRWRQYTSVRTRRCLYLIGKG